VRGLTSYRFPRHDRSHAKAQEQTADATTEASQKIGRRRAEPAGTDLRADRQAVAASYVAE
jgi:hypothetical protein